MDRLMKVLTYRCFSASLMTCSTGNAGFSFKMEATTFWEAPLVNPSMVSAATASSCISLLGSVLMLVGASVFPRRVILSFKSTMMRCAVFRPIPFTVFNKLLLPAAIKLHSSEGE